MGYPLVPCRHLGGGVLECAVIPTKYIDEWLKRHHAYMESIGARKKLPPLPDDVEAFVRSLD